MGKMLTTLLLLCCLSVTAGDVEHITTDAEYFDPQTMRFYIPLKKGQYRMALMAVGVNDEGKYSYVLLESGTNVNLQEYLANNGKTENSLINLKKEKSNYPAGYGPQINSISFNYDSDTDIDYSEWNLRIIDPDYALMRGRRGDRNGSGHSWREFFQYGAAIINNRIAMYVIQDKQKDHRYIIVNTGTSYIVYTNNTENPVLQQTNEDLNSFLKNNYPGGYTFTENGKEGVRTLSTVLIPAAYDKVEITPFNRIVARKGSEIHLYYQNGDRIDITGIRAVHYNLHNISILKGNEVYWVARDGELLKEPSYGLTDDFYRQPTSSPQPYTEIVAIDGNWILHAMFYVNSDTKIISQDTFKAVTFTNGSTRTEGYALSPVLIAETTDGQKALLDNKDTQYTVVLGPGGYTFSYDEHWKFVLFEKEGLKGSWPQNKDVRYTKLDNFDKGFARFTLPDGKQGWLAKDGTEYLDQ
jgi:hypothetical protein